jgi:hypothetical protein
VDVYARGADGRLENGWWTHDGGGARWSGWIDLGAPDGQGAPNPPSGSNRVVRSPFDDQPADKAEPVLTVERLALPLSPALVSARGIPMSVSKRQESETLWLDSQASKRKLLQPLGWLSAAELDLLAGNLVGEL